jgi:hypothetical protein
MTRNNPPVDRDKRHTPQTCVHNPNTKGAIPACEGCRVYPLSSSLPDPHVRGHASPDD